MRRICSLLFLCVLMFSCAMVHATTPKNWTFLIYLNGNNNLDEFGKQNIEAMEQVGSDDQVNIVVQWASESAGKTVRMLIQKSKTKGQVISPIVEDLGKVDMGDYRSLQDFIKWGAKHYPAQHYFVNVWNHGSGWHSLKSRNHTRLFGDISWDDNTGHSISTEQLGQAMANAAKVIGHPVDLYGSDACLMAMAEVANEMLGSVHYFVGSQETEPGAGWPYTDFLSRWEATPNATPDQVSKILVDAYVKSYEGGSNGTSDVTLSAYDLTQFSGLNQAVAKLGADIRSLNATDKSKVLDVAKTVQSFAVNDYADLLDFVKKLSAANISGINQDDLVSVQAAAQQVIIANEDTPNFVNATGLSIWLPTDHWSYSNNSERYQHMAFNVSTQWGSTLDYLLQGIG